MFPPISSNNLKSNLSLHLQVSRVREDFGPVMLDFSLMRLFFSDFFFNLHVENFPAKGLLAPEAPSLARKRTPLEIVIFHFYL